MKYKFFILFFSILLIPLSTKADWIRLFSINSGDLYLESSSVLRKGNNIFFSQLVNYNNKQKNGILSFTSHSEVNCLNLKIRDLKYELFRQPMGLGKDYYSGTPTKKWKKYAQGTSAHLVNKLLCERVYKK